MSERSFFTRLGQHISFVYNQIVLYPVQSTIIAFNIIFVVGGAIACRRCYIKSRKEDALVRQAKRRKRRTKYEPSEKSSSSDTSEPQSTVVDIESDTTNNSEPTPGSVVCYNFRQKRSGKKCKRRQETTSSDSDDNSTTTSVSDSAVTIDIHSSESTDGSQDPLPKSPQKPKEVPRSRSVFTNKNRSKFTLKKTSSCAQTEVNKKPGKKTTGTQTTQKKNSSTQTTNKNMENRDCYDSNDSGVSWYHAIQRFRKPNIVSPPILTGRYRRDSHINDKDKHQYSHDVRDAKVYRKKGGKKTIFGVALKPVCNSDGDDRHLARNFDPNLTNFSVSPRVK